MTSAPYHLGSGHLAWRQAVWSRARQARLRSWRLLASCLLPTRLHPCAGAPGAAWGRGLGGVRVAERDGLARISFPTRQVLYSLPDRGAVTEAIRSYYMTAFLDQYDLTALLRPGAVFLDIGAHVGSVALLASHLVGAAGRVLAVEPHEGNFRCLEASVRENRAENVTPVACAAGHRPGTVALARAAQGSQLTSLEGRQDVVVSVRSVDELVDEHGLERVDFIKIDTEGMEREVLAGAAETVRWFRPTVAVAAHHRPGDDERLARVLTEMRAGYRLQRGQFTLLQNSVTWAVPRSPDA